MRPTDGLTSKQSSDPNFTSNLIYLSRKENLRARRVVPSVDETCRRAICLRILNVHYMYVLCVALLLLNLRLVQGLLI